MARGGLLDLADAPARRLSGGEAQRASLARALVAQAEVLLLDEPTANVDASSRRGLVKLIEDLGREQKLSIIVTTHDHSLEAELCQRRIYLSDGRLISVNEAAIHGATLVRRNGGFYLGLPPEAGSFDGPLTVLELAEHNSEALLKLKSRDRRVLSVRISGEADLKTARQLTLKETLQAVSQGLAGLSLALERKK